MTAQKATFASNLAFQIVDMLTSRGIISKDDAIEAQTLVFSLVQKTNEPKNTAAEAHALIEQLSEIPLHGAADIYVLGLRHAVGAWLFSLNVELAARRQKDQQNRHSDGKLKDHQR